MNIKEALRIKKNQITDLKLLLQKKEKKDIVFPSGAKNLDKILGGGFKKGKIYLFFGANRTGKTQLCHQICIQTFKQLYKKQSNKSAKYSLYYDTENTFRSERIEEISKLRQLNYKRVLNTILVSKIMSNSALLMSLQSVKKQIRNNSIQLLIIDTINNYYRSEMGDPAISFSQVRNAFLNILQKIYDLTKSFNLITILTAQITPNFIEDAIIEEYPVGLHYLNHFFSEMFYLSHKNNDEQNLCYIHRVNSSFLPEKKLLYKITPRGLVDYKI